MILINQLGVGLAATAHSNHNNPRHHFILTWLADSEVSGHRLLLSADEGVFLAELDDAPAVP